MRFSAVARKPGCRQEHQSSIKESLESIETELVGKIQRLLGWMENSGQLLKHRSNKGTLSKLARFIVASLYARSSNTAFKHGFLDERTENWVTR